MKSTASRRAVITALAAGGTLALIPEHALALPGNDAGLIAAWEVRQKAVAAIHANGPYFRCEYHSPAETDILDQACERIGATDATTVPGAIIKAWNAWQAMSRENTDFERQVGRMIRAADFAGLEAIEHDLDWEHQCMLSLIRSLNTIGEA